MATFNNGESLASVRTKINDAIEKVDGTAPVTGIDINSGTIDGATIATSDITVGSGKTLDVSGGTLTLANDQISGDKINGGTIGSVTITSADINGGTIDGTVIGGTTPAAGSFTTGQFGTSLNVDGTVTADGLTLDAANSEAIIGSNASYQGKIKYNDGLGEFEFRNTYDTPFRGYAFYRGSTDKTSLRLDGNGDISFYETTGTTPKMVWKASDQRLGIGTDSPSETLHVASGFPAIKLDNTDPDGDSWRIASGDTASGFAGKLQIYNEDTATVAMMIDSSGSVGIGTPSPDTLLHLNGGTSAPEIRLQASSLTSNLAGFKLDTTGARVVTSSSSSFPLAFDVNGTERMRIDSSGNVGIGTSSPWANSKLQVRVGADQNIGFNSSTGNPRISAFNDAVSASLDLNFNGATLRYETGGTERMRILSDGSCRWTPDGSNPDMTLDSSGNLLVGKTSDNQALAGVKLGTGGSNMSRNNEVLVLNRLSTDGTILNLKKDGSTVGSIGTEVTDATLQADVYLHGRSTVGGSSANNSRLWLLGGDSGIVLDGHTNAILPTDENSYEDGRTDIGSDDYRFKDLYLSGGVYLGGTGVVNKLDDYEEGTFSPTLEFGGASVGVSYTARYGRYVKVGKIVYVNIAITLNSKGTSTGNAIVSGLPFTQDASGTNFPNLSLRSVNGITFTNCLYATANDGATTVTLLDDNGSGTQASLTNADFLNSTEFNITGIYETT